MADARQRLAAVSWGANKNHSEPAQVTGIVSLPPISTKGCPSPRPLTPRATSNILSLASGHPDKRFHTQSRDQLKHSYGSVCCGTLLPSDHSDRRLNPSGQNLASIETASPITMNSRSTADRFTCIKDVTEVGGYFTSHRLSSWSSQSHGR